MLERKVVPAGRRGQKVDPLEYRRKNNKLYPNVSKLVMIYRTCVHRHPLWQK